MINEGWKHNVTTPYCSISDADMNYFNVSNSPPYAVSPLRNIDTKPDPFFSMKSKPCGQVKVYHSNITLNYNRSDLGNTVSLKTSCKGAFSWCWPLANWSGDYLWEFDVGCRQNLRTRSLANCSQEKAPIYTAIPHNSSFHIGLPRISKFIVFTWLGLHAARIFHPQAMVHLVTPCHWKFTVPVSSILYAFQCSARRSSLANMLSLSLQKHGKVCRRGWHRMQPYHPKVVKGKPERAPSQMWLVDKAEMPLNVTWEYMNNEWHWFLRWEHSNTLSQEEESKHFTRVYGLCNTIKTIYHQKSSMYIVLELTWVGV